MELETGRNTGKRTGTLELTGALEQEHWNGLEHSDRYRNAGYNLRNSEYNKCSGTR